MNGRQLKKETTRRRNMCGIMSTIDFSLRLDAFYGCILIYGGDKYKYCSIICFYVHLHCALKAVGSNGLENTFLNIMKAH